MLQCSTIVTNCFSPFPFAPGKCTVNAHGRLLLQGRSCRRAHAHSGSSCSRRRIKVRVQTGRTLSLHLLQADRTWPTPRTRTGAAHAGLFLDLEFAVPDRPQRFQTAPRRSA